MRTGPYCLSDPVLKGLWERARARYTFDRVSPGAVDADAILQTLARHGPQETKSYVVMNGVVRGHGTPAERRRVRRLLDILHAQGLVAACGLLEQYRWWLTREGLETVLAETALERADALACARRRAAAHGHIIGRVRVGESEVHVVGSALVNRGWYVVKALDETRERDPIGVASGKGLVFVPTTWVHDVRPASVLARQIAANTGADHAAGAR